MAVLPAPIPARPTVPMRYVGTMAAVGRAVLANSGSCATKRGLPVKHAFPIALVKHVGQMVVVQFAGRVAATSFASPTAVSPGHLPLVPVLILSTSLLKPLVLDGMV